MSIRFHCPNCGAIIAFHSRHAGKRAKCLNCGQLLIIPPKNDETPEKVKEEYEYTDDPAPGFYRAVFWDSLKIFFNTQNLKSLLFVITVVCFKFFLANACCMNYLSFVVVWGWLLAFYLNIIYETAFEIDNLPEVEFSTSELGGGVAYLLYIINPFITFLYTMLIVQMPFIIALVMLEDKGLTYENMWQARTGLNLLLQVLLILGLFLFPVAILTTAVGKHLTLFRPDYVLTPILKAPISYLLVVAWLVAAALLENHTTQFKNASLAITAVDLGLNLAVQVVAIIAMRSIGLFYRHYSYYFKW